MRMEKDQKINNQLPKIEINEQANNSDEFW